MSKLTAAERNKLLKEIEGLKKLVSEAVGLLDHAASDACALAVKEKRDNAMAAATPSYVSSVLNQMHKRHAEYRLKYLAAR
jgi:hypothetical protein